MGTVVMRKQYRSPVDGTGLRQTLWSQQPGLVHSRSLQDSLRRNVWLTGSDRSKDAWAEPALELRKPPHFVHVCVHKHR